jgi:hypothetical protein
MEICHHFFFLLFLHVKTYYVRISQNVPLKNTNEMIGATALHILSHMRFTLTMIFWKLNRFLPREPLLVTKYGTKFNPSDRSWFIKSLPTLLLKPDFCLGKPLMAAKACEPCISTWSPTAYRYSPDATTCLVSFRVLFFTTN